MREELRGLLDERSRPSMVAEDGKGGGAAAEISDNVHELRDDVHDGLSRLRPEPLPGHGYDTPPPSSSRTRSIKLWAARLALALRE